MQSGKHSNRQNKKNRSQNSGDFVFVLIFPYAISRNFFDESQSKLIVKFLTRNGKATIFHNVIVRFDIYAIFVDISHYTTLLPV